jgi:uncharacterized protein (TIGR02246 family)
MRRFVLLLALSVCPLLLSAQAPDQLYTATKEQLDVTKVLLAQQAAWNKGDLDAYLAFYKDAPDTRAILSGPVLGVDNIRASYRASFPNAASMGSLEQSDIDVRELGPDFGLATGKYRLLRAHKYGGDTEGTFTTVMEKTAGGWKVIFSQTT